MKFLAVIALLSSFSAIGAEVKLGPSEVEFDVTRDIEVSKAVLSVRCLRKASFFEQFSNGLKDYMVCDDFTINGVDPYIGSKSLELKKVGKNKFVLDKDVLVKYSKSRKGHVCLTISADFTESVLYQNDKDVYSVLGFCTVKELPVSINDYIYNHRRVGSLEEFTEALARPIQIDLK